MGDPKAFLNIPRQEAGYRPIHERITDFSQVEQTLNSHDRKLQASRCMLPDGMKPRQVHVLDAVNEIQKKQGFCRVSDISSYMNTTLPSITKLVQELEERNLLVKQADEKDKRVINLTLTEEGKEFVELRVTHFHGEWASRLPDLDDAVVDEFVHAITRMQETMPGIKGVKNNGKRK